MHVRFYVNRWTLSSKIVLAGQLLSSLVAVPPAVYKSGSVLHFDGAIQQILPAGSGSLTLGVEGFCFDQVTCDSGAGATLGCCKGMTSGLGPVLG